MKNKFKVMLAYENGNRFVFPFDVVVEALDLSDEQMKKVEEKVLLELSK